VVASCARTAIGNFGGALKDFSAAKLGSIVIKETLKRANLRPSFMDRHPIITPDLLKNEAPTELEKKYDDGVARLYRAIEVLGQTELKEKFGIDTSDVKVESLPPIIRDEYRKKYLEKHGEKQKIKIPLMASYRLLKELGSETAGRFFESYEKEIRPIIAFRNHSILAHGFISVDEKIFKKLFEVILKFSKVKEEDLPLFPTLKI